MAQDLIVATSGLYRFVLATEQTVFSSNWKSPDVLEGLSEHARALAQGFSDLAQRAAQRLSEPIDSVKASLADFVQAIDVEAGRQRMREAWEELSESYEALVHHIRRLGMSVPQSAHLGHIKPRNIARNVFHVSMGVFSIVLYELFGRSGVLAIGGSLLGVMVILDTMRRFSPVWRDRLVNSIFGEISRPSEAYRVPSAVFYLAGLVLGVVLFPKIAIELGALVLAFGDPAASLVGKRWGKKKLWREKSVAGALGFFAISWFVCTVFLVAVGVTSFGTALLIAALVAVVGALTETYLSVIDDNLSLPLVAGATAMMLLAAFG